MYITDDSFLTRRLQLRR